MSDQLRQARNEIRSLRANYQTLLEEHQAAQAGLAEIAYITRGF